MAPHGMFVKDQIDVTEYDFRNPSPVDPFDALTTAQQTAVDAAVLAQARALATVLEAEPPCAEAAPLRRRASLVA